MAEEADDLGKLTVVRDPTFSRAAADSVLAIDLGRDLELAFLQLGPIITSRSESRNDDGEVEGYQMQPSLAEVARIRMPHGGAFQMAMNVIDVLIRADKIHKDRLSKAFDALLAIEPAGLGAADDQA